MRNLSNPSLVGVVSNIGALGAVAMKSKTSEPFWSDGVVNDLAFTYLLQLMFDQIMDVDMDVAPTCEDFYLRVLQMIGDYRQNFPVELSYAFMAWAATVRSKPKYPKDEIRRWLKKNTKLSNEAIERISIVANWDKKAGRRRKY
jgi:hypothetical protein